MYVPALLLPSAAACAASSGSFIERRAAPRSSPNSGAEGSTSLFPIIAAAPKYWYTMLATMMITKKTAIEERSGSHKSGWN